MSLWCSYQIIHLQSILHADFLLFSSVIVFTVLAATFCHVPPPAEYSDSLIRSMWMTKSLNFI